MSVALTASQKVLEDVSMYLAFITCSAGLLILASSVSGRICDAKANVLDPTRDKFWAHDVHSQITSSAKLQKTSV